jgi:hypothetical protein
MDFILSHFFRPRATVKFSAGQYFKAGSYVLIIVSIFHLFGQLFLSKPSNNTERELLYLMTTYKKEIAGASLSMMEIQDGLSLCYALFFLFTGCMNLFLANNIYDKAVLKPISLINALAFFVGTVISLVYFFWLPVVSFALAMTFFTLAGMKMRPS